MADELKRVGLAFTADGVRDFKKELKECSAATKENYSELKLAQSQYDKNTTSAKKLEDRQKYLANQTEIYKDKVSILNSQLKEMESAENRDETAISKKKAELNDAQAKLNNYEKSLKDVNKQLAAHSQKLGEWGGKLQEVGGKMQEIGGKISDVGEGMTKNVTVPVAAAGAASVATWKEVDEGLDIVIKKTGATGDAAEGLKNNVKNLTSSIPTDFKTAGEAVGGVNTRFSLTGQGLEDLSGKFIKFAELNDTDVSTSIDNTQKVLEAFNLSGDDADEVLDLLNKTGQKTGIGMDTLSGSLVSNSKSLRDMGFSVSDSAEFLGQLETSGLDSSTALAGLKKAVVNAAKEGKPMSDALKEAEDAIKGAGSETEATQIAMELFGNKAGPAIAQAVRDGKLSFEELGTSLSDYAGSVEGTFNETLDPLDKVKMLMNDLKVIGADIVDSSAPMIEQALSTLRDVVKDLSDKWNSLDDEQKQAIIKFALVAAAVGPVLIIVGKVIAIIGGIISGIGGLLSGIGGIVGAIMAAGGLIPAIAAAAAALAPFLIGGAIIVAIIAAIVLIIKNWDKIKEAVSKVVNAVKESWNKMVQSAKDLARDAKQAFEDLKAGIKEKIDAARDFAGKAFDKIKGYAKFVWNLPKLGLDAITSIPDKVKDLVKKIKGFFDFKWSLPNIPLPHFSVSPSGWQIGDLLNGTIPSLDIDWYAKAYDRAAYYTRPTIRPDGRGYGDRQGGEFAVGESRLHSVVSDAVRKNAKGEGIENMNVTINVYANPDQDVKEIANEVANKLRMTYERERLVWT